MSEGAGTFDGALRIDDSGLIVSANEKAAKLFGGSLDGEPLAQRLIRHEGSGQWKTFDGRPFEAESFSVRRDEGEIEIRLRLPDPGDDTITRRKQDSLLHISSDVFRAGPADLDQTIVEALGRIAHLTRADRAYLLMFTPDGTARNTHEWSRAGTSPQIDRLGEIPAEAMKWFRDRVNHDECLLIGNVADFPPSIDDVRQHLSQQGIQSLLAIGIFEDRELIGVVGFDTCRREARWSHRSVERLRMIAELFVQSLLRARTSRELERARELFDLVRSATSDIIYDWDLQNGSVRGQGLDSFLGAEPPAGSSEADWWFSNVHPAEREAVRQSYQDALEDPAIQTHSAEFRVGRPDGSWAWLFDRSYIVRDGNGKALRVIGSTADMTERVNAEEELRKQQELFHYVRLATNDIIWETDLESGKAWRSESMESVLGIAPSGDHDWDWWMERIHPEDREECDAKLSRLFSDRGMSFMEHTYRIQHRDGTWVSILDRGYVVRDEDGRAKRMIGTCTDVTEQQRALRRLKESEGRFKAVVENVSDVIAIVDRNGIIVYESPSSSRVFGYSSKELVGQSVFHPVHPEDRQRVETLFRNALKDDAREARATVRYRHAAGHWLTIETVGANFIDREQIAGIVLVSRDITHRRLMDQQLERSARLSSLGHLASAVAHEFNNVLMGAQPFVEVITRKAQDNEQVRSAAMRIAEALEKGKKTSRSLLTFARPISVSLETIDLRGWISTVESEIRGLLPESIGMKIEISDEPLKVTADPMALHQSLLNLVLNACDVLRNREDGMVVVEVRPAAWSTPGRNDYITLSVSDNGPQLAAEVLEHIFDPMFSSQRNPSAGLELAVVHQLITAQSGRVTVESDSHRTTYCMYLRASEPSDENIEPEMLEEMVESDNSILLVEDNAIVASGIAAILELDEQAVDVVETGAAAIAFVKEKRPSVMILDIGLPDMNGIEVYEAIARDHPDLPVIFSSGHGDQQELKQYLTRPNVEFLLKPYDAQTLMSIVERLRHGRS